jgi:hypothetical protein
VIVDRRSAGSLSIEVWTRLDIFNFRFSILDSRLRGNDMGGRHPPLIWNDRVQGKNRIHFLGFHAGFLSLNRIGFVVLDFRGALNGSGRLRR